MSLVLLLISSHDLQTMDCETQPVGAKNVAGRQYRGDLETLRARVLCTAKRFDSKAQGRRAAAHPGARSPGFSYAEGVIQRTIASDANIFRERERGYLEPEENTMS